MRFLHALNHFVSVVLTHTSTAGSRIIVKIQRNINPGLLAHACVIMQVYELRRMAQERRSNDQLSNNILSGCYKMQKDRLIEKLQEDDMLIAARDRKKQNAAAIEA